MDENYGGKEEGEIPMGGPAANLGGNPPRAGVEPVDISAVGHESGQTGAVGGPAYHPSAKNPLVPPTPGAGAELPRGGIHIPERVIGLKPGSPVGTWLMFEDPDGDEWPAVVSKVEGDELLLTVFDGVMGPRLYRKKHGL